MPEQSVQLTAAEFESGFDLAIGQAGRIAFVRSE
jgi:hypothetical protein